MRSIGLVDVNFDNEDSRCGELCSRHGNSLVEVLDVCETIVSSVLTEKFPVSFISMCSCHILLLLHRSNVLDKPNLLVLDLPFRKDIVRDLTGKN